MKSTLQEKKKLRFKSVRQHTIPYNQFLRKSENWIIAKITGQTPLVFRQFHFFNNIIITYNYFVNFVVARAVKNCTERGVWWSDVTLGEHTDYSQCLSGRSLQDKIDVSAEIINLYDIQFVRLWNFFLLTSSKTQLWLSN